MATNFHGKPFDEGTLIKLSIYQSYLREWLPVFIASKQNYKRNINIIDFFAGPGSDKEGAKGTPLIIMDELRPYIGLINEKRINTTIYLNEIQLQKYKLLRAKFEGYQSSSLPFIIKVYRKDFKVLFDELYSEISAPQTANLLFLDQCGLSNITPDVFSRMVSLPYTDFLFFISSSTLRRFSDHPDIKKYISLERKHVQSIDYYHIHRHVLEYYRKLIPTTIKYYLAPFSIKKGANIYGIIFGSHHILGMEKFLNSCWRIDPIRGEANYDIDHDKIIEGELNLFTGSEQKPKKIDFFEMELQEKILKGEIKTNREVYFYTITNGFQLKNSRELIKKMMTEKKITRRAFQLNNKVSKDDSLVTSFL